MTATLAELRRQFPNAGEVVWIGLRPARRADMRVVEEVTLCPQQGLVGDRYAGRSGKRQVTLIDEAHLAAAASYLQVNTLDPALLRRNIVVRGINLRALKEGRFRLGPATLAYTDECHPCSRMEEVLGPGGYNALRGHGGICARVIVGGVLRQGAPVTAP